MLVGSFKKDVSGKNITYFKTGRLRKNMTERRRRNKPHTKTSHVQQETRTERNATYGGDEVLGADDKNTKNKRSRYSLANQKSATRIEV